MRALAVLACLLWPGVAAAQDDGALHQAMQAAFAETEIVGAAYAVVEDGEVVAARGLGLADREAGVPVTPDTTFRIGSVSKNVTSLLAVALAEDGVLDLDAPVRELVPDPPFAPHADGPVRLVHLLEHTAGLPGSTYAEYAADGAERTPADYAALTEGELDLRWSPGLYYSYANAGHTLAALAMERATGEPFDALVRTRLFEPLGMTDASFSWGDARPVSYRTGGGRARFWELAPRPSGALQATPADMARLLRFYASRGASAPGIASPEALARMRRGETALAARAGYPLSYGLGTFGFLAADRVFYGHWGRVDGFQANMGTLPESGDGFVLLANTDDRRGMGRLREVLAGHVAGGLPPVKPLAPTDEDASRYAGWYAPFTHDMEMRSWLFGLLGLSRAEATKDGLSLAPAFPLGREVTLLPLGGGTFTEPGAAVPTHQFAPAPDGRMTMLGDGQETYARLGAPAAWGLVAWAHAAALAVAATLLAAPVLLVLRLTGRARGPAARSVLLGAGAAASLIFLLYGFARLGLGGLDAAARLGAVTVPSVGLLALSLLWPALAALALWQAIRSVRAGPRVAGAAALAPAAILVLTAAGLAATGWLPLVTWS